MRCRSLQVAPASFGFIRSGARGGRRCRREPRLPCTKGVGSSATQSCCVWSCRGND